MDNLTIVLIVLIVFCIIRVEWVRSQQKSDNTYINYNFRQIARALNLPVRNQEEVTDGTND